MRTPCRTAPLWNVIAPSFVTLGWMVTRGVDFVHPAEPEARRVEVSRATRRGASEATASSAEVVQ